MTPLEDGVNIITASSDHMIMDVEREYQPGETMSFRPLYPAMLACATSEYVAKRFV
jgi:predicted amino acid racemase